MKDIYIQNEINIEKEKTERERKKLLKQNTEKCKYNINRIR
jgi:hypothetical protein